MSWSTHRGCFALLFLNGASSLAAVGSPLPSSLCQQLAVKVRHHAPFAVESVLATGIVAAPPVHDPWGPRELAENVRLRQVLELQPDSIMDLQHLPGTSLYMGSVVAGTAECQRSTFAELTSKGRERILPAPPGYTEPCWNLSGSLAWVLGNPAYVESGTVSSTSADAVARITPWTGHDWAPPCQLTVELNYTLELAEQFCTDADLCGAAGAIALDLARRYVDYSAMQRPSMRPLDDQVVPDFIAAGVESQPRGQALVAAGWHVLQREQQANFPGLSPYYGTMAGPFPTFGHQATNGGWLYNFSYVNFALFAVLLDGRLYLGAIGHNGVGWREGSDVLITVYDAPNADQAELVPHVGFVVKHRPTGIKDTVVLEGG